MAETAIERIVRCLNLIPYIRKNPGISPDELARIFNTTPKIINKDLETLFMCGLPGYSHLELIDMSIEEDSVIVIEPQNLGTPPRFTKNEAISISVALLAISSALSLSQSSADLAALRAAINETAQLFTQLLAKENANILSLIEPESEKLFRDSNESVVVHAITNQNLIECRYINQLNNESEKQLKPLKIFTNSHLLYFMAIDLKDNVEKIYRLDRVREVRIISKEEIWSKDLKSSNSIQVEINHSQNFEQVKLALSGKSLAFDKEHPLLNAVEIQGPHLAEGSLQRTVLIPQVNGEWLISEILLAHGGIKVVAPQSLSEQVVAKARLINSLY